MAGDNEYWAENYWNSNYWNPYFWAKYVEPVEPSGLEIIIGGVGLSKGVMNWMDNFADEMNKTATIYSRTYVPDGMGGGSYTNTLLATVKGAFWQKSAAEQFLSARISNTSSHVFACKPNSNFTADNIIIIDGVTYKVSKPDDVLARGDIMTIGLEVTQ